jgi:N-methylhydantoinase B
MRIVPARPEGNTDMPAPAFDPASLNILWTRLVSMVDEAAATFCRTCFSTLVREANDYAVILTDTRGRSIAQSAMSIPSFIGTLPATVRHVLKAFPPKTLRPGDFIITNDPWLSTGHVYDVSGVMPLFHRGTLVGFGAVASHVPDIGGRIWGTGAREIFEEGLQIPLSKLLHAGEEDELLVRIIRQNVRVPELTLGDLYGQVAACRMLEERLCGFIDETGVELAALSAEVQRRSERAMRRAIAALPDGHYCDAIQQDGFGEPLRVACAVDIRGERLSIDFSGSSPQLPWAVNVVPVYSFAYAAYAVKALLEPELPNNEGSFKPISTWAPEGSVLNPRYPAASGARHIVGHLVVPAVMGALSAVVPERAPADGSGNAVLTLNGEENGERYSSISFMTAGQGATATRPGQSMVSFPSNVGNTPIEVLETQAPVLVRERSLRRGSGGRGARRGGDGGHLELEFRGSGTGLAAFQVRCREIAPRGRAGGAAGRRAHLRLNGREVDISRNYELRGGDVIRIDTAGGGGHGTPTRGRGRH